MNPEYTYKKSEGEEIWTVGHDDNGTWIPESDWESEDYACRRANILNWKTPELEEVTDLRKRIKEMHESHALEADQYSNDYHRGAADACGLILDLPELRLFLPAKDGGE